MANVIATIKIMPEDIDVDLEALSKKVSELGGTSISTQPIAFGLKAIICNFTVPDGEGGTQDVEDKLSALEGVSEVQVTALGREIDASQL